MCSYDLVLLHQGSLKVFCGLSQEKMGRKSFHVVLYDKKDSHMSAHVFGMFLSQCYDLSQSKLRRMLLPVQDKMISFCAVRLLKLPLLHHRSVPYFHLRRYRTSIPWTSTSASLHVRGVVLKVDGAAAANEIFNEPVFFALQGSCQ